jgi:hypothetical protein
LKPNSFEIKWHFREEPRVPAAVVASGEAAKELARNLLASDHTKWASWKGVATSDAIVLLGEAETLPWVDGVAYLGSDERAPQEYGRFPIPGKGTLSGRAEVLAS